MPCEAPFAYYAKRGLVRIYRCSVCGSRFEWGPGAEWYGSWKDVENQKWEKIAFFCSAECKAKNPEKERTEDERT